MLHEQLSEWQMPDCVESKIEEAERASIVFVHGLTGDRERTWTHQSSSCFWPEELLPPDLPDARIFTYGYDADVAHFFSPVSQSRIGNYAQTLLGSLAHVRERTETVSYLGSRAKVRQKANAIPL